MAATSGTSEMNDVHKDVTNSGGAQDPAELLTVNNDAQNGVETNTSNSNAPSTNNESTATPAYTKLDEKTGLNISSEPSVNLHTVQRNEDVSTASGHQEPEETAKTQTSTGTPSDSTSSGEPNKYRRKSKDSPSDQTNPKKSNKSKDHVDVEKFETSDISSISYEPNEADLLESVLNNATNKKLIDRLFGCAYGQALGDAYGLSTEFEDRERVDRHYLNTSQVIPFPNYILTGHNRRWKRGDWTDDTDQWILILVTLMFHNGDEKVFAKKLSNWIRRGYAELGDHAGMGLGANVSQVVHSYNYHDDPLGASKEVWERGNRQAAPNGAVMRCSASAFVHFNDPEQVVSTATLMCKTTHFDPRCIASCVAVCLAVTYLLREEGTNDDIETLIKRVQNETIEILGDRFTKEDGDLFRWFTDERTLEELNLDEEGKIGYTYKCLASGFYGLRSTRPFDVTLNDLIRYGGDADTNGAVCGTMYGARHGYKALPSKWLRAMPNKKWFDQILIKCLEKMDLNENAAMVTD